MSGEGKERKWEREREGEGIEEEEKKHTDTHDVLLGNKERVFIDN